MANWWEISEQEHRSIVRERLTSIDNTLKRINRYLDMVVIAIIVAFAYALWHRYGS